jgi:hypothetical protein
MTCCTAPGYASFLEKVRPQFTLYQQDAELFSGREKQGLITSSFFGGDLCSCSLRAQSGRLRADFFKLEQQLSIVARSVDERQSVETGPSRSR